MAVKGYYVNPHITKLVLESPRPPVRILSGTIFWTSQPFVTKLGRVVLHHELECHVKKLHCCLQGQDHSEDLKDEPEMMPLIRNLVSDWSLIINLVSDWSLVMSHVSDWSLIMNFVSNWSLIMNLVTNWVWRCLNNGPDNEPCLKLNLKCAWNNGPDNEPFLKRSLKGAWNNGPDDEPCFKLSLKCAWNNVCHQVRILAWPSA